jgi:transposase
MIPKGHLLRRIDVFVTAVLGDLHEQLGPFYSDIGRPSIDPQLLIRMHLVGYCFGIRSERKQCEELRLHLAYRWFCRLDLDDPVPDHSTFSVNRHGRFRDSNILRHAFEAVVRACIAPGSPDQERLKVYRRPAYVHPTACRSRLRRQRPMHRCICERPDPSKRG